MTGQPGRARRAGNRWHALQKITQRSHVAIFGGGQKWPLNRRLWPVPPAGFEPDETSGGGSFFYLRFWCFDLLIQPPLPARQYTTLPDITVQSYCHVRYAEIRWIAHKVGVSVAGLAGCDTSPLGDGKQQYVGPDHKLHKAPHTFHSDVYAESWLAIERRKIDLGTWGTVERSDGCHFCAPTPTRWIEHRQLRPRTRAHYESMLERLILPHMGDMKIVTLTPAQIREWHAGLGSDHHTRNAHAYALLHAICATAVQDEVLDANPCRIRAAMQTKRSPRSTF